MLPKYINFFFLFLIPFFIVAQPKDSTSFFTPSQTFNSKRFKTVVATEAALYTGSLIALNSLWYNDYPRSSFHLFDDSKEWLQMDKAGHVVTSYTIGVVGIDLLKWSGVERKKAIWYGGVMGSVYQSTIEILDGFSTDWGFSVSDFSANTLGTALVIGQELLFDEQRFVLKYSFHQTTYPQYRINVLGSNLQEQLLKDYNGQTYWLSANIHSFLKEESRFPKWLNIAVGYGAEGMIGAEYNPPFNSNGDKNPTFDSYRKMYISLDADLSKINFKSPFLKTLFKTIGFIKIPAPAISFSEKGTDFFLFYF